MILVELENGSTSTIKRIYLGLRPNGTYEWVDAINGQVSFTMTPPDTETLDKLTPLYLVVNPRETSFFVRNSSIPTWLTDLRTTRSTLVAQSGKKRRAKNNSQFLFSGDNIDGTTDSSDTTVLSRGTRGSKSSGVKTGATSNGTIRKPRSPRTPRTPKISTTTESLLSAAISTGTLTPDQVENLKRAFRGG